MTKSQVINESRRRLLSVERSIDYRTTDLSTCSEQDAEMLMDGINLLIQEADYYQSIIQSLTNETGKKLS